MSAINPQSIEGECEVCGKEKSLIWGMCHGCTAVKWSRAVRGRDRWLRKFAEAEEKIKKARKEAKRCQPYGTGEYEKFAKARDVFPDLIANRIPSVLRALADEEEEEHCTECGDDGEEPNPYCHACGDPDMGVDAYKEGEGR
jgi:hypothetical protein